MLVAKVSIGLLVGTGSLHLLDSLPSSYWIPVPIMLALLSISHRPTLCLSLPALFGFTWAWYWASQSLQDRLNLVDSGRLDVGVVARVVDFPRVGQDRNTFLVRVVRADRSVPKLIRLSWYVNPPRIRLGDRIEASVRLREPSGLRNTGLFDFERWLFVHRIGATGYVRSGEVFPDGGGLHGVRQRLATAWAAQRADAVPLLVALSVGSRHRFQDHHWMVFRQTATSHLVAISGLHVGLAAGLFLLVFRASMTMLAPNRVALRSRQWSAFAAFLGAFGYALLAGFGLPTQRALWMLLGVLSCVILGRAVQPPATLFFALIGILITDPLAPLREGFWLSFGAVAILLASVGSRHLVGRSASPNRTQQRSWKGLRQVVRVQLIVTVAMVPVVAVFFGMASPLGAFANIIAIPWFSLILVPSILCASAAWLIHEPLGALLMPWAAVLANWSWQGLELLSMVTMEVKLPATPLWVSGIAGLAAALWLWPVRRPGKELVLAAFLPLMLWREPQLAHGAFRFELLDVGQGQAAILQTANHTLVYDAGPAYPGGFDAGSDVVAQRLWKLGVGRVDRLMISHGDNDHAGGLSSLARLFEPASIVAGKGVADTVFSPCLAGMTWIWDGVTFTTIHPRRAYVSKNDASCVLKVQGTGGSLLLTGDIESVAESDLVREQPEVLRADVVLLPHHGSDSSSTPTFVAAVGSSISLVSAGFSNRWGLPSPEVVERWSRQGAEVIGTADMGAIRVAFPESGRPFVSHRERLDRRRYWQRDLSPGANPGAEL